MADPALQTFCCYPPGKGTDPSVKVLLEFNSRNYNYVCLVSSAIGILGAAYQVTKLISVPRLLTIWTHLVYFRPRYKHNHN